MDAQKFDSFLLQIPELEQQQASTLIDYFAYYLEIFEGQISITSSKISTCFDYAKIRKYSNIPTYLKLNSKSTTKKKGKFIAVKDGYQVERSFQLSLQKLLNTGPSKVETSYLLRSLLSKINNNTEKIFLQEAINCYEIGARRASIVMVWLLTISHLYDFILSSKLNDFNNVLSKNTDKRIKITQVHSIDDFSEIPENKFIEFLRSANIISNDVRKILDVKLGIRNSTAHPSSIIISEVKATEFIQDLVDNVVTKY
jgi:hypothetical protein